MNPVILTILRSRRSSSARVGVENSWTPLSAPASDPEIPPTLGGGEPGGAGTPTATRWMNEEFEAEFERQHRSCRRCHPELGRDYVRAAATLGALSLSLVAWIVGITLLATRWN